MAGSGTFAEIIDGDVFKYHAQGQWNKSSSGKFVPIINPTTRKIHFKVQGNNVNTPFWPQNMKTMSLPYQFLVFDPIL